MIELHIVEIAGSPAGGYAAKLLADQGARVDRVEPRGSATDVDLAAALDGAKTIHRCELDDVADRIAVADIVIRSTATDPLRGLDAETRADVVMVEISPFGSTGPYAGHRSSDLVDQAISGHLVLNGDPDREPVRGPEHQVAYAAGLHAAIGALAAVRAREVTGTGQRVEIAHHDVMMSLHQFTLLRQTHSGDILKRMGNRYAGPGTPVGAYQCADGLISLTVPRDDQLERLLAVAGLSDLVDHPDVETTYDLMHHPTLLADHLLPWLLTQDVEPLVETLQAMRVPAAPVRSMAGLLADPHLEARSFWQETADGTWLPGPPFRIDAATTAVGRPPPPDLRDGPLTGLLILDITRVWAGPLANRILADLGADVILVEAPNARGPAHIDQSSVEATHYYPNDDPGERHWNRIGFLNKYAVNKRGLAIDLTDAGGREALEALIRRADVLVENYSPRVMPQFGLDEQRLHELNPDLVYVTMPGFGRSGPAADWVAYGPMVDSHAGLSVLAGYAGEPARKGGVAWPDPVAGMHAAFAVLAVLTDGRASTTVELAQIEAAVNMVGHALAAFQRTGAEPELIGNRHPQMAPQGVYPAAGDDQWIAVSAVDDAAWHGLCEVLGAPARWRTWTVDARRQHHGEIDEAVAAWSRSRGGADAAEALQAAAVPAAVAADAAQVMADPHLAARKSFVTIDHPEAGAHAWPRVPIRLSATPASYRRPAPLLGQHNAEILRDVGGLDDATITDLTDRGVLVDRPPD